MDDGTYAEKLLAHAVKASVSERVEFAGRVAASAAYDGLSALIVTNGAEPLGRTVGGEAMLHAVPVVVPSSGGAPEWVSDNRTGLIYSSGSASSLARSIAMLLSDFQLRQELSEAGRAAVLSNSSPTQDWRTILHRYQVYCVQMKGSALSPQRKRAVVMRNLFSRRLCCT